LGNPLLGFGPPTRYVPKSPPPVSRPEAPLLGFHAPTTHWEERVHVRLSPAPRFCRGICPRVPPRRLRCRSQVFSTSQRLLPLPTVPRFSRGWRSWGLPYRGFPSTKPRRLVAVRPTLLTLLPRADRSPFLGGDTRRRGGSYLGAFNPPPIVRLQGLRPRGNRSDTPSIFTAVMSDLPLLGFCLLMV
jgi:hypothetical protein